LLQALRGVLARAKRRSFRPGGLRRVSDVWGDVANTWRIGGEVHWTELEQVQRRINRRVSGDPEIDPYLHFIQKYLGLPLHLDRVLTLGCGFGEFERGMAQYGTIARHDAFDIAPTAIEEARRLALEGGLSHVNYGVADLNEVELEPATYDCVFGIHAVHHLERLEHVFSQIRRALKPGGWFVLNEFVGPTRFQWTERQLEVVNGLLAVLPERLRRNRAHEGRIKSKVERPTIAEMCRIDPSEAVRSAEIMSLLPRSFEVVEFKGYGGTVLHLLLHEIAGNFRDDTPGACALLDAICDLEEGLIAEGSLSHDFAFVVAKRP
jgi:SAM-dependent methyltransferase